MNKLGLFVVLIAAGHTFAATTSPPLKPSCGCSFKIRPVCGSDGETYRNECLFNCTKNTTKSHLEIVKEGRCNVNEPCYCPEQLWPVCGTDGLTYPSLCSLRCEQYKNPDMDMKHKGGCSETKTALLQPCKCTREMNKVCGTDGVTYNNPCLLNCAMESNSNLRLEHPGPCESKGDVVEHLGQPEKLLMAEPSVCACTRHLEPVCASNGATYSNPCMMRCHGGKDLTVVHQQPCL